MTRADMDAVRDQFVAAVRMGLEAGFDMVELHAAHGYLLSSFITPLQNQRTDEYGGVAREPPALSARSVRARCAPPGRATGRCRCASRPPTGPARTASRPTTRCEIGEAFAREGADLIDVSAGQTWAEAAAGLRPHVPDAVQRPASATRAGSRPWRSATSTSPTTPIRSSPPAAPTWSRSPARIWSTRSGRCAPPPQLDYRDIHVPPQYLNGMSQLARNLKREAEAAAALRV